MIKLLSEKRKFKRLNISVPVSIVVVNGISLKPVTRPVQGVMYDITPAGARIEVNEIVIDGLHLFYDAYGYSRRKLKITMEAPGESGSISLFGRIAWYNMLQGIPTSTFVFGAELLDLTPEDRKRLHAMLYKLSKIQKEKS